MPADVLDGDSVKSQIGAFQNDSLFNTFEHV